MTYIVQKYSFDVGYRFYYWDHYRMDELYIKPKYKSLKEDIRNNTIQQLHIFEFNISIQKVKKYIDTFKVRKIRSRKFGVNDKYHYNIQNESQIKFSHLLSVVLYTDWSDLSESFSKTFRRSHPYESVFFVKKRNAEYANWSKALRETIEYYGGICWRENKSKAHNEQMMNEYGPFFSGMSNVMVIPQLSINLNSPTSTTTKLETIATVD